MANRYWVGGTATWDNTAGTKWATTSGGTGGAAAPTAADDVFLDANSGAVTVTTSAAQAGSPCRSLNCTGFTGTLHIGNSVGSIAIGDASGGALTFVPGMSLTFASPNSSIYFRATSTNGGAGWPITTGGKGMPHVHFGQSGTGGKWTLQDAFSGRSDISQQSLTLSNGELNTNNQTVTIGSLSSSNSNARTLTLGTSTVNLTRVDVVTIWDCTTATNLTVSAANATIVIANASANTRTIQGAGKTFGTLRYTVADSPGQLVVVGGNTFGTVEVAGGRSLALSATVTTTVTDEWNVNGSPNGYVYLPGVANNALTSADSVPTSITGDIDIRIRVAIADLTPAALQTLVAKDVLGGSQRSYSLWVNTGGTLGFGASPTGVSMTLGGTSSPLSTVGITDGMLMWYRVTRASATGQVKFYYADGSLENPVAADFTQIGGDITGTSGTIFNSTAGVEIGASNGGANGPAVGKFYRVQIRSGIDGTLVYDADLVNKAFGANSFAESSANALNVNLNGLLSQVGDGRVDLRSTSATAHVLSSSLNSYRVSRYAYITASTATGTGSWYAPPPSVNGGTTTGWQFTEPVGSGFFF